MYMLMVVNIVFVEFKIFNLQFRYIVRASFFGFCFGETEILLPKPKLFDNSRCPEKEIRQN